MSGTHTPSAATPAVSGCPVMHHGMSRGNMAVCPVTGMSAPPTPNRSRSGSISSVSSSTSQSSALSAHSALSSRSTTSSMSGISDLGPMLSSQMLDLLRHETRDAIQSSWALAIQKHDDHDVTPVATFVNILFAKLFEVCPETRLVFGHDMVRQGKSLSSILTGMLEFVVHPKKLQSQVKRLAHMHVGLGVTPDMFEAFGFSLLYTIRVRIGSAWNQQIERVWVDTYGGVSNILSQHMSHITLDANDIPSWMVSRYLEHHAVMMATWKEATDADSGERVLNGFFTRLQVNDPQASHIYETADARMRKVIIWSAVTKILDCLENPRSLRKELKPLAQSHAHMGVTPQMIDAFGTSLCAVLKEVLQEKYTTEVDVVWRRCFRLFAAQFSLSLERYSKSKNKNGKQACVIS
ncbi:hypothetical protein CAOG_04918 [Capsaspora owczarzaki ATCC 30864]|uniref:Globin domain-containing protein n=1 Tax=Capsaspora owczarzaki (strain ATCC 30864) TaxID=595528 RepID=A0A0D2X3G1_CAPO3|nr:hypothetical protein CAOG_04918 [Capsaspora owczarzaki ATCC 30864]KJE94249.1 hypothetical protein CAOG_004918 [Capsaspora owczarzaki ATCC 30864]|eukprot:XP_004347669.1 hypothetical protein CAOG_04918 [Capsaspora owczarzaki ATCC 30864]